MKDGRTHLAHKAEHTVDLETGAVVGVTVQGADTGDTASMVETLIAAAEQVDAVLPDGPGIEDVVGDKGYHSNETMADVAQRHLGAEAAGRLATAGAVGSCGVAVEERKRLLDLAVAPVRAEQRPLLRVVRAGGARMAEQLMPDKERHTQRAAGVARRRLNPDVVERSPEGAASSRTRDSVS